MPKKSKSTSKAQKVQEEKQPNLVKKPSLDEYLKQASDWFDKWGKVLCQHPWDDKEMYLTFQKGFYVQNIQPMSNTEYNKYIQSATKNVVDRFTKIIDKSIDNKK